MTPTSTKKTNKILFLAVIIFLASFYYYYRHMKYNGDGYVERNLMIYPAFKVSFDPIKLGESVQKKYSLKGMPNNKYTLELHLDVKDNGLIELKKADEIYDDFDDNKLEVEVILSEISDITKQVVIIERSKLTTNWTFAGSKFDRYFWNEKFVDTATRHDEAYILSVGLYSSRPSHFKEEYYIIPVVQGGGMLMP